MTTYHFDHNCYRIERVVIVGLGGTGAELARLAARTIYHMQRCRLQVPQLVLIDFDTIDEGNIGRQAFAPADLGQPKSQVVAKRLSYALGLDIQYATRPFHHGLFRPYGTVLCGAVDNHHARQEMAKTKALIIDCGNDHHHGQVVIGNTNDPDEVFQSLETAQSAGNRINYLPTAGTLFPDLLEQAPEIITPEPAPSCAEDIERGDQHLLINNTVAAAASAYLYNLLFRKRIDTFLTHVTLDPIGIRSVPINRTELVAHLQRAAEHVTRTQYTPDPSIAFDDLEEAILD